MTAANHAPAAMSRTSLSATVILLCWLAIGALWFSSLSFRDLAGTDEGRYAEIAREMAQSGDFVTPRLNDLKYFEKPALQYWASAALFQAFGESEFVARLWPGICGFLAALLVWYTGRRLWGATAGLYAGFTTVSMLWVMGLSHVVTVDMGVSFFLTAVLCGFLIAQDDKTQATSRRKWMFFVWAAMAGAMLSKGLIGIVIPGAALVFYSLIYRDWITWPRMEPLWGPLLFLALAAPWFVIVSMRNPEFAKFFFIHEHFGRFATDQARRTGAWYYFVPLLLAGLFPWTTLLPSLTRYAAKRESSSFQPNGVLLVWCSFIFLFFSVSSSKLPAYLLPMFPALGLLLGRYLEAAQPNVLRKHAMALAGAVSVILIAGVTYLLFFAKGSVRTPVEYHYQASYWVIAGALGMIVCAALAARSASQSRKDWSVMQISLGGVFLCAVLMDGYQVLSPLVSAKNAAAAMTPYLKADTEVFSVERYDQTLPFYIKRTVTLVNYVDEFNLGQEAEPHKWIPTNEAFALRWNAAPNALAITNVKTHQKLQESGLPMTVIYTDPRRVVFKKP
ncbi:phospholipid carrier-dependent glycosyltransferase [Stenotrophobium rhamnosiphilum]|uniref:Phospholipid carrier-dependent glycosyltransferase n=2 Tax=Stenotrophobium rhamnosiphilum TaxID=2029166 RepID=A0A2T5MDK4_9GAMM|nr:phospholipid carrier-dependent glycosyltransferase [Stenotrophobium rhamnosiphilum]